MSKATPPPDVAAVITAMTDHEKPYLVETVRSVLDDPGIGQVLVCVEEHNEWAVPSLGALMDNPRVEIARLPMCSAATARNRGMERVRLPWTAFCDGDDVWCEGKTAAQRVVAERTGCDFVGADHYLADEQGRIRAFALARYIPMPSTWLVRTEVMRRHPFPETVGEDYEDGRWWRRTTGLVTRARCPRMLIRYRVRPASASIAAASRRRKSRIVHLGSIPFLGKVVLAGTALLWLLTRRGDYLWHPDWEPAPDPNDRPQGT